MFGLHYFKKIPHFLEIAHRHVLTDEYSVHQGVLFHLCTETSSDSRMDCSNFDGHVGSRSCIKDSPLRMGVENWVTKGLDAQSHRTWRISVHILNQAMYTSRLYQCSSYYSISYIGCFAF